MTDRSGLVLRGVLTGAVSRGAAAVAPLVTVPIALGALGASLYGAWSSALALTALAVFADLGLGAGLMTRLAAAVEDGDTERARRLVSSAYVSVAAVVVLFLTVLWASAPVIDWGALIAGRGGRGDGQIEAITLTTFTAFLIAIVANLIVRVQYATGQMGRSNLWQASGTLFGVLCVVAAARSGVSGAGFVAVAAFAPPAVAVVNTALFFRGRIGRPMAPGLRWVHRSTSADLMRLGAGFLAVTTLMSISISVDTWIVGRTLSLPDAAEYSVLLRIFTVIGTLVSVLSIPLWPNHAAALRSGDLAWVNRTTRRMLVVSPALVGLSSVAVAVSLPWTLVWWLGDDFRVNLTAAWGLALWNVVQAVAAPLFMVQNAAGALRPQLVGYALLLLVVPVKWVVSNAYGYGPVPLVTVVGYVMLIIPAAVVGYRTALRAPRGATEVAA